MAIPVAACEQRTSIKVCLTDKYPNIEAFENARRQTGGQITFYPGFVDAASLPRELSGFRTIFTSFHHFTPDEAVAILQNAADDGQGIGVFEAAKRDPLTILLTTVDATGGIFNCAIRAPVSHFENILDLRHPGDSLRSIF